MTDNDNNNISDDQLSQFLAFTGSADPNVAKQYLEMAGNNVEMAVSLFMDHNGSGGAMGGNGGSSGVGDGVGGGMGGMGSPEVRAPDATRSMRLVGGPPSPLGGGGRGGAGGGGGDDAAALMAAVAGPNAAAQMMMMGMMGGGAGAAGGMGGIGGGGDMDDIMASTWASRDLRETVNRAAAAAASSSSHRRGGSNNSSAGNRRNRSSSGSGAAGGGGGGGGGGARNVSSGSSNNDNGGSSNSRRRRRTNSSNNNDNNNSDDDDEVQVVDEHGNAVGEVMMEDSDDEDSYHYNDDESDDDHSMGGALPSSGGGAAAAAAASSNQRNLSTMFQPPTHLTHRAGGFLGAKNFAKDARRWLLVNIQTDDDFACHALNRDVWHDELVENLVREGFVLWQSMSTSPEGMTYVQRYKVEGYPHIAIIDPRTGSLLYRKEGWTQVNPLTAEQFVEIASDFCSRHSFDKLPMPARHGYANGGGGGGFGYGGGGGGESSLPAKRPVHELSEQEQLEAAIRASMEDASPSLGDQDDDDDEVQILEDDTKVDADKSTDSGGGNDNNNNSNEDGNNDNEEEEEDSKLSPFEKEILSMTITDEPTSGTIARVQLRMPDGKRLVRKFDGDASIKTIYAFVAQSNDDAKGGKAFELKAKFPPVDLLSSVDESISSFGLSGETITALWK